MPTGELVVADASPLLNLALIERLDLVRDQFSAVVAPEQVWDELVAGEEGTESLRSLRQDGALEVVRFEEGPLFAEFRRDLDVGESAALAYAIRNDADLVLIDEREGRSAARRHDLDVTGAIGVLLRAHREGRVDVRSELDALRAAGFWISDDLYEEVLDRANTGSG